MSRKIASVLQIVIVFAITFATSSALASTVAQTDEQSLVTLLTPVVDAFLSGNYLYAGALAVVLLAAVARRYGARWLPFFGTDAGGALLVLVSSLGASLASTTSTGQTPTGSSLLLALKVAFVAAGGYTIVKRLLITPILIPLSEKHPWLKTPLSIVLWIFERADKVRSAEKAGADAVKKTPPTGVSGVIGEPRDLP